VFAVAKTVPLAILMLCACLARGGEPSVAPVPPETDPDIELAGRLERAFQKLAQRIAPCVVSLQVQIGARTWMEELRRMSEQPSGALPERQFEGSGVIVDAAGLIITNEHVVRGAEKVRVKLADGRSFEAKVCGTDPRSDLAMLKIAEDDAPANLVCAALADSDKVQVGQYALAIGNPFGLSNSLTVGVVSALGRSMGVNSLSSDVFYGNLIQTDAAINPGNSGGPLFDLRGKLMGINTMIFSRSGVSQGCGFAIPSNHLRKRLAALKDGREIEYGWLGVRLADLRPGQREFKVPDNKGVLVDDVIPNTPADRAGVQRGMVIVEYDGQRVAGSQDLMAAVNDTPVGQTVLLKLVDRRSAITEVKVRIGKRYTEVVRGAQDPTIERDPDGLVEDALDDAGLAAPGPDKPPADAKNGKPFSWRGMQVKELAEDVGRKRGGRIEVVRVRRGSPADRAGVYEGAVLTELKHAGSATVERFGSLDDFRRVTGVVKGPAALLIPVDGFVTVEEK
jgi:serine protease Do